jgi:hypothetical protein
MARRKAKTYGVRDPFGTTTGVSRRANRGRLRHRALLFPLEGRIELRLKLGQLAPSRTWEEWLTAAIGVWVFISPWVLGAVSNARILWSSLVVGALLVILALWSYLARARTRSDRNATLTREPKVRAE